MGVVFGAFGIGGGRKQEPEAMAENGGGHRGGGACIPCGLEQHCRYDDCVFWGQQGEF